MGISAASMSGDSTVSTMEYEDKTITPETVEERVNESGIEEMECLICMESVSEETILPCQCKLHYCQPCWDKALANSFSQCGQARCPSCRALVRVDFDAEKQRMVFTPETTDMTTASQTKIIQQIRQDYERSIEENHSQPSQDSFQQFAEAHDDFQNLKNMGEMRSNVITRLRHQAMPAQIQLLQGYSRENPSLLDVHTDAAQALAKTSVADLNGLMKVAHVDARGCLEKSELVARLVDSTDMDNVCALWASQKCSAPKCVCQSSLRRIGGKQRFRDCLGEQATALSEDELEQALLEINLQGASFVICDICEEKIPLSKQSFVWTCENRNSTILHATSYDICDKCFVQRTCKEAAK